MKRTLFLIVVLSVAGVLAGYAGAACFGPFCYDDTGFSIGGVTSNGNGTGTVLMTQQQISSATPTGKGQEVFCTDCTSFAGGKGYLCVSTGTTRNAYMAVSSAAAVSACN